MIDPARLDDERALASAGARTMLGLAADLGSQLRDGFARGAGASGLPAAEGIRAVVVCGMGGSGIAGDVARALLWERLSVPLVVVKGYRLPAFCDRDTLVLAASFSGNTEETVAAYTDAVSRGCRTVAVSVGGRLAALAAADGGAHVAAPADIPMPRAALGALSGIALGVLEGAGVLAGLGEEVERAAASVDRLAVTLGPSRPCADNEAKSLAGWIGSRTPVVWGSEGAGEVAALRWKNQVNENAKGPAVAGALPELDHNEVEGWSSGTGAAHAAVLLRHPFEHPRTALRVAATREAVAGSGLEIREAGVDGGDLAEALFGLVMLGDFASTYLAVLRAVDPLPVPVLSRLKERLSS